MRTRARRDGNEAAVIQALELDGWLTHRVSSSGFADLVVWRLGWWYVIPVEVKNPDGRGRRLTKAQKAYTGPRVIVERAQDAAYVVKTWGLSKESDD